MQKVFAPSFYELLRKSHLPLPTVNPYPLLFMHYAPMKYPLTALFSLLLKKDSEEDRAEQALHPLDHVCPLQRYLLLRARSCKDLARPLSDIP
mmetsp:Transcript_20712/g.39193  ORF Transcript_20712/g.39193 Transcript_20712/m.39193 type:complete len:93 (+) Transcript_20712:269-547(+)